MCDKDQLVSYVYDELHGAERKAFQHHLASCLSCREEVQALGATRTHLAAWTVPDGTPGVGFQELTAARRAPRLRIAAWPLAAAAAVVLAIGSMLARVEVSVADGGVTIRAGAARAASDAAAPAGDDATRQALAALSDRVRELDAALAAQAARGATPASAAPAAQPPETARIDESALLRRVQQLINESEGRQRQQFAVRLMQVVRELQAEHAMDLVRLEQNFNQHQALSNDDILEMKQYLRLVNQQQR